jgi:hypothetical protein
MSDRAPVMLRLYAVPTEATEKVQAILTDRFDNYDWCEPVEGDIRLGGEYVIEEEPLGLEDEIAQELIELGCAFDIYQEAKYEYDGAGTMHVPGVGTYGYTGGNSSEPMILASEVDALLTAYAEHAARGQNHDVMLAGRNLADRLAGFTGKRVRDAIAELREKASA